LFVWDNELRKRVAELEFNEKIVEVRVVRDWVVIVLENKVVPLYFLKDLC
jgi:hypothetical protein